MKSFITAASAVALVAIALPASAQVLDQTEKSGAYGVLGYSHSDSRGGADQNFDNVVGKAGWRFNRFLGVEGEASFGFNGDNGAYVPSGGTTSADYDSHHQYSLAAYGVGYVPLSPKLDLFGRVGYGTSRYKIDAPAAQDIGFHEESWNFGGGAQYRINGRDGIRAEYTRESMDHNSAPADTPLAGRDVDNWAVSYVHQF